MADLLLEIGTEELPAGVVESALEQLQAAVTQRLQEARIAFGAVETFGTPRRLILFLQEVAPAQTDVVREVRGPAANIAFDAQGHPTPAALGFARKQGVDVSELEVVHTPQGDYVMAKVFERGKPTVEVAASLFPEAIRSLTFPKMMRWGSGNLRFCRPIRWLLALYGGEVVPFELDGIRSGNRSRGHRFLAPEAFEVRTPADLFHQLDERYVLYDHRRRREVIREQANRLAEQVGGHILWDDALLDEVTHLVEYPTALLGRFEPTFLNLPEPILITAMKKHQRFFAVVDAQGKLLPYFVAVRNGDDRHLDVVRDGNERVLTARFNDAHFFYERDRQQPLEAFVGELKRIVFQERLGTMADKTARLAKIAREMAEQVGLDPSLAERAATLCKADLATEVVMELPALQGVMGREYALLSGEENTVAQAIAEHYMPRFAGDDLPESVLGRLLAVCDRVDTLVGYVGALGIIPTGSGDPFGLRRAAQGVVQILATVEGMPRLWSLVDTAIRAYAQQGVSVGEEGLRQLAQMFLGRMEALLEDEGVRYDVVQTVLAEERVEPFAARANAHMLNALPMQRLTPVALAATRVRNILKASEAVKLAQTAILRPPLEWLAQVDTTLFQQEEEHTLHERALQHQQQITEAAERFRSEEVFSLLEAFTEPVNRFFDAVLVMAPDEAIRRNRLLLLAGVDALYRYLGDFSKLVV
ncbi:MAG: glycine--tRNA ligase beta subunit [Armatimonadota bacterium]|nr:MAG: glycine--tRNA ligase beta subunit [Armatimonadota bacterium]